MRSPRTSPRSTAPRSEGHDQPDHRSGAGGDAGLDQPAAGADLRGGVHRRGPVQWLRQGPRRPGRQPTVPSTCYAAIGVDLNGRRDVLGLWAGTGGGESAKFWMNVLTDLKNRGVRDVFFVVCDAPLGTPRRGQRGVPGGDRAGVRHPSDPGHPPVRLASVLGSAGQGSAWDLHRTDRRGGLGRVRGAGGEVGQALPGDPEDVARRVGGVHTLPRLRSLLQIRVSSRLGASRGPR